MIKGATISECGKYRYKLWRAEKKHPDRICMFIMLNPSTADGDMDDPTIRRCMAFASSWGYDAILVGNVLPYRATDPGDLFIAMNSGVESNYLKNLDYIMEMIDMAKIVVCAWGNGVNDLFPTSPNSFFELVAVGEYQSKMRYLDLTINGIPKHPLYLKGDLKPQPFNFENGKD